MNRKKFIRTCGLACVGGMTMPVAFLSSCSTTNYIAQHSVTSNLLMVKKSEFIKASKNKTQLRQYVLVKPESFEFPVCIYNLGSEKYSAILMKCTHKGCELQPQGSHLVCPCHGSEFSNLGVVQNPPAEENLQVFKVTTDNENIILQL